MKDIGKILKNARENKEYTQKQVMELTGIHRKSLSGYENNVAEPDLSTFATLANLYGISADEALEIGEPDPSVSLLRFEFQVLSTTIYLWLISLTASKELSILLLKLYNDGAIGISNTFLDSASVIKTDNQLLIRSVRFMQVESP